MTVAGSGDWTFAGSRVQLDQSEDQRVQSDDHFDQSDAGGDPSADQADQSLQPDLRWR